MSTPTAIAAAAEPRLGFMPHYCTLSIAAHIVAGNGSITRRGAAHALRQAYGGRTAQRANEFTQQLVDQGLVEVEEVGEGEELLRAISLADLAAFVADGLADREDAGLTTGHRTARPPAPRRAAA